VSTSAAPTTHPAGLPAGPAAGRRPRFTDLLAAERIKLASTRSPWWCGVAAVALPMGFMAVAMTFWEPRFGPAYGWQFLGGFATLPLVVVIVLATLAVTAEYRFGTIRTTFQAVPDRAAALVAKTVVVTAVVGVLGVVAGFGTWAVGRLVAPQAGLVLATAGQWRAVAGTGLVWAVTAVLGLGVGIALRHSAGAISVLLGYVLVGEAVLANLPRIGADVQPWLPFVNLSRFLTVGVLEPDPTRDFFRERTMLGPWWALAYAAAVASAVLLAGIATARRRDA